MGKTASLNLRVNPDRYRIMESEPEKKNMLL